MARIFFIGFELYSKCNKVQSDSSKEQRPAYRILGVHSGVFGERRAVGEHFFIQGVQIVVRVHSVEAVPVERF